MLIVGLGNPGKKYSKTRHNVGYMFVDQIAEANKATFALDSKIKALVTKININDKEHIIIKPTTYMNDSGFAVKEAIKKYNININDVFVIFDDMALEPGKIRIRKKGSSGGQKGMKSIIDNLGTNDILRLRIGIGEPETTGIEHVLTKFNRSEKKSIDQKLDQAPNITDDLINHGVDYIMNKYNE